MTIHLAQTTAAIAQCFPVMVQLRPHLTESEFIEQVLRQQTAGYHLAYLETPTPHPQIVAVAGFRITENLAWGQFLYVDDLVTNGTARSQGYGHQLLTWLVAYAQEYHCTQIHLDSGVMRHQAHKFYLNQGLIITGYHFASSTPPPQP